jgi:hypothetical protein
MDQELPIELECFLLRTGIMPVEFYRKVPDVAWPKPPSNTMVSQGWKPTEDEKDPPF